MKKKEVIDMQQPMIVSSHDVRVSSIKDVSQLPHDSLERGGLLSFPRKVTSGTGTLPPNMSLEITELPKSFCYFNFFSYFCRQM